jgi:hypothetical protein
VAPWTVASGSYLLCPVTVPHHEHLPLPPPPWRPITIYEWRWSSDMEIHHRCRPAGEDRRTDDHDLPRGEAWERHDAPRCCQTSSSSPAPDHDGAQDRDGARSGSTAGGGDGEEARLGSTRGDWGRRRLADWNTRSEGIGRGVVQALVREENSNLPLRVEIFFMG